LGWTQERQLELRRHRLGMYMQLKEMPAQQMRQLYADWGIPLSERQRMRTLVMHRCATVSIFCKINEKKQDETLVR
jgi:Fe-S cluster assembly scaffold protein SufB